MIIKRGDRGKNVKEIQKALKKKGYWPYGFFTENFYKLTDIQIRKFQKANGLVPDGKVGRLTIRKLGANISVTESKFNEKYKRITILGSCFPDDKINTNVKIRLNKTLVEEYLPEMKSVMSAEPIGFQLLMTIMTYKEGFRHGTRSYRYNNPGNIGNTDSGANKKKQSLKDGILLQRDYLRRVADGKHPQYKIGKRKVIRPYFSKEIAKHTRLYGISPYVPGYDFIYTGRLDQFVKIYSTGARASNSYLSMIISFFKNDGIIINEEMTIKEIIKIKQQ